MDIERRERIVKELLFIRGHFWEGRKKNFAAYDLIQKIDKALDKAGVRTGKPKRKYGIRIIKAIKALPLAQQRQIVEEVMKGWENE